MKDTKYNTPTCSGCGNDSPQPFLICFDCSEGTDINGQVALTGYCSTPCRNLDKPYHKSLCTMKNNRKALYRAGEILQEVFYMWREIAFDIFIKSTWKTADGTLCFHEDHYPPGISLFRFPNDKFSNLKDKQKMLSYAACTDAQGHLFQLCQKLLEDLASESHELSITIPPSGLAIRRYYIWGIDQASYHHEVLEVILDNTEGYIVDLAGAQHGQFLPVMSSKEFMSHNAVNCTERRVFGFQAGQQKKCIEREIREGKFGIWRAGAEMRKRVKVVMEEWEVDGLRTISELPRSSKRECELGKETLLVKIRESLQSFVDDMESGRWFVI